MRLVPAKTRPSIRSISAATMANLTRVEKKITLLNYVREFQQNDTLSEPMGLYIIQMRRRELRRCLLCCVARGPCLTRGNAQQE